jgi:hypothetical protein
MDYLVNFDALPWRSPLPGVREKRFGEGGRIVRLVEYSQSMDPHWCVKGHVGHIVEGTLEFEFAHQKFSAAAGDVLFIPAGAEHDHRVVVRSLTALALFVEDAASPVPIVPA